MLKEKNLSPVEANNESGDSFLSSAPREGNISITPHRRFIGILQLFALRIRIV